MRLNRAVALAELFGATVAPADVEALDHAGLERLWLEKRLAALTRTFMIPPDINDWP